MNILAALGPSALGLLTPAPLKRAAAAWQVNSLARAYLLGRFKSAGVKAPSELQTMPVPHSVATQTSAVSPKSLTAKGSSATDAVNPGFDEDTFLRLFTAQLQYQDPLSPVGNSEMVNQLSQFATLEQISKLNTGMTSLGGNMDQLNFISAAALLGRKVTGLDITGAPLEGVVQGIQMENGMVYLTVNDKPMSMAGVLRIDSAASK